MSVRMKLWTSGVYWLSGVGFVPPREEEPAARRETAREGSIAWGILRAHNKRDTMERLSLRFDAMVSPDNNYVSILQTVRAAGIRAFSIPWVLTNCHHTLCAVGGTVNEDDHAFGLACAQKYGGIFVPPYQAVIHQYMREAVAGCGQMILGSDSHTRYGPLGTLGIGEGGAEVARQALGQDYELRRPDIVAVELSGALRPGVGPMDVALTLLQGVRETDFFRNKILEFVGEGVGKLSMDTRLGIDVMTTESGALSSIWTTDEKTLRYLRRHGRQEAYASLEPKGEVYYDGAVSLDLTQVEPMLALPFRPSNAMPIRLAQERAEAVALEMEEEVRRLTGGQGDLPIRDKLRAGRLVVQQAMVAGCAGGSLENLAAVADILGDAGCCGGGLRLGVNPASRLILQELMRLGVAQKLVAQGVELRPCICGPCFGVTDVPANGTLSARHVTRNYFTREGSKPGAGQLAACVLMDARSIAATVRRGGVLTPATDLEAEYAVPEADDPLPTYKEGVYCGYQTPRPDTPVPMGPNIADWPDMAALPCHLLLQVAGRYQGDVTTDELSPSGEAASFRSNPERASAYTLSQRDPGYVERARQVRQVRDEMEKGGTPPSHIQEALERARALCGPEGGVGLGSMIAAPRIGEGSSREQAASCQRVLGGWANLAGSYAAKRYRSNLINWGILPLRADRFSQAREGRFLLLPEVRSAVQRGLTEIKGVWLPEGEEVLLELGELTQTEREILLAGCVINYYRTHLNSRP